MHPLLAGLVASLPFQKSAPGALALCALVPFFLLLRSEIRHSSVRRSFRLGWLYGVGFFAGLLYWVALLSQTAIPVKVLAGAGFFLLVAYLALFPALFALAVRLTANRIPFLLVVPIFWGAVEYLRTLGPLGFPWGALGYTLVDEAALVQIARFASVDGVTLFVVAINAFVTEGILAFLVRRTGRTILHLGVAVLILLFVGIDGVRVLRGGLPDGERPFRVVVVQPNIAADDKWTEEFKTESIRILSDLTREAVSEESADLVVWPETAVPVYIRHERTYYRMILDLIEEVRVPILLGFPDAEYVPRYGFRYFNAALLLDEGWRALGDYRKMHLVPFGERLPLSDRFDWIGRLDFGEADFTPGDEYTVFRDRGTAYSANICFEAIFPSLCREFVRGGARFLVNLTNDAWFGTTSAPGQHAAMARFRAIESGIYLARSANTGISLVADPFGRIVEELPLLERGFLSVEIVPIRADTFYLRAGDWLPRLEWLALALLLLAAFVLRRRAGG